MSESSDKRIESLRRALRFYANEKNYRKDDWNVRSVICGGREYGDPGRKARAALARDDKDAR